VLSSFFSDRDSDIRAEGTGDRASREVGLEKVRLLAKGDAEDWPMPRDPAEGDEAVTKLFLRIVMFLDE